MRMVSLTTVCQWEGVKGGQWAMGDEGRGKRANVEGTKSGHAEWLYWAFVVSDQGNLGLRE